MRNNPGRRIQCAGASDPGLRDQAVTVATAVTGPQQGQKVSTATTALQLRNLCPDLRAATAHVALLPRNQQGFDRTASTAHVATLLTNQGADRIVSTVHAVIPRNPGLDQKVVTAHAAILTTPDTMAGLIVVTVPVVTIRPELGLTVAIVTVAMLPWDPPGLVVTGRASSATIVMACLQTRTRSPPNPCWGRKKTMTCRGQI